MEGCARERIHHQSWGGGDEGGERNCGEKGNVSEGEKEGREGRREAGSSSADGRNQIVCGESKEERGSMNSLSSEWSHLGREEVGESGAGPREIVISSPTAD